MGDFGFMFHTVFSCNSFSYKKYFSKTSDWQTLARNLGYTYPCVAYTNEHALENKMKLRGRDAALPLFL